MSALAGCATIDATPPGDGSGGVGLLGDAGNRLTSGRPDARSLPPIARGSGDRERTPFVESGTGRYVDSSGFKQVEVTAGTGTVALNFVDVELQEFVRVVFDEVLKTTVVVDPALNGRVTVRATGPITQTAALDLVRHALQNVGAVLSKSGAGYRVTARTDQRANRRLGDSIRIVPVRFVGAEEARSALSPFIQTGVEIGASASGQYLTISGPPVDLDSLEQVLATIDVDQLKGMSIALLPLREASATAVANELNQVFGKRPGSGSRGFHTMPITRMNAVLITSPQPHLLTEARKWMARLDRSDRDGRRIYVYPVQNRQAAELVKVLNAILDPTKSTPREPQNRQVAPALTPVTRPGGFGAPDPAMSNAAFQPNGPDEVGEPPREEAKPQSARVSVDGSTNSIVVTASHEEWRIIEAGLRRLDVLPPQVLIEATIAEVQLNASLRHGVRWFFQSGKHGFGLVDDVGKPAIQPGLNYVFGTPNAHVALNALQAVTNVEIVSSPALTVLDNQTAKLQVGDQVPVATRSARSVISPDAPIVNDIEFKDTGVILAVTPRVNASGLVVLHIAQEVSDVVPTTTSNLNSPTIRQRRINSSVAVHSGTEIVLGGLIGATRNKAKEGVPLLIDIPIVGEAFKSQASREYMRTELLVILRPTVMGTRLDVESVTREIKARMSGTAGAIYR